MPASSDTAVGVGFVEHDGAFEGVGFVGPGTALAGNAVVVGFAVHDTSVGVGIVGSGSLVSVGVVGSGSFVDVGVVGSGSFVGVGFVGPCTALACTAVVVGLGVST